MSSGTIADPDGGPYLDSFERSQKAAAHDLKGATAFLQYAKDEAGGLLLVVALQALIDFAGYRLQAMLILPLETIRRLQWLQAGMGPTSGGGGRTRCRQNCCWLSA